MKRTISSMKIIGKKIAKMISNQRNLRRKNRNKMRRKKRRRRLLVLILATAGSRFHTQIRKLSLPTRFFWKEGMFILAKNPILNV